MNANEHEHRGTPTQEENIFDDPNKLGQGPLVRSQLTFFTVS